MPTLIYNLQLKFGQFRHANMYAAKPTHALCLNDHNLYLEDMKLIGFNKMLQTQSFLKSTKATRFVIGNKSKSPPQRQCYTLDLYFLSKHSFFFYDFVTLLCFFILYSFE